LWMVPMVPQKSIKKNIKILLLTGKAAASLVKVYAPENTSVFVLPINVAAFINSSIIKKHLPKTALRGYDLVMVPGLVSGDLQTLTDYYGVPFVKGPRYASDIPLTLRETNPFELSSIYPADKFLKKQRLAKGQIALEEGFGKPIDVEKGEFLLGFEHQFPIGIERPPLIMAEIVDAPKLSDKKILERAKYYLQFGADVLDIGAVANNPQPERIATIIQSLQPLKKEFKFLISVDTLNSDEIFAAIKANVELILSIDHGNIETLLPAIPPKVGVVFIPTNVREGKIPRETTKRVESLLTLKEKLIKAGLTKLFADPIIEMPIYPGFTTSLEYYMAYRKADIATPMMTCIGNVTEFIAADPIGINALFGSIAVELGIQLLLVTDVSVKCRGGIKEVKKARDLAFIAKQTKKPPKGVGVHLLMAKSRVANDFELTEEEQSRLVFLPRAEKNALYTQEFEPDPQGNFIIWVDYHQQRIYTRHLAFKTNKPTITFACAKARPIFEEIIKRKLVSKIDHAYYLGRELERAEICLYLGKTFVQDEQTFQDNFELQFEK
ncbi:MAG: dihydropteroate synthase-like protein, partial [Candidatus Heimdallarchaeota archaeon]